jgi:hypothetical protein
MRRSLFVNDRARFVEITAKISGRVVCPGIEDRLHRSPTCLDIVGVLKQGRIAEGRTPQHLLLDRSDEAASPLCS